MVIFTNTINNNYQLRQSRNLFFIIKLFKHHPISNYQQLQSLLLLIRKKTIPFFVTKIPPRTIQTSQTMTTFSPVKHQEKKYIIQTTSTPNHHAQRIGDIAVIFLNLSTTSKLPPLGKEYICFQNGGKYDQTTKCFKYWIMTKLIDCVISIYAFEHQCVVLKGMLQPPRLKYHMETVGIDQSLINSALFEHRCLQNIKKLYKHTGKCDDQQQLKYILEAAIVSTPEGFNHNSIRSPMNTTLANEPSAGKSLCLFTNIL